MKKIVLAVLACCVFAGCASNADVKKEQNMEEKKQKLEVGNVCHFTYKSEFCGMDRGVNVLLPFDYDENKQYKVIYFLHGIFGNEYSISGDPEVQVREFTAKAAAEGKDIIVVFPDMFARKSTSMQPGFNPEAVECYDNFVYDLTQDLMPWVKAHFSIMEGRENTAVCGFSMGGRESLAIGLQRSDLFGYIGAFAPAPGLVPARDYQMEHVGQFKESDLTFEGKNPLIYLQVCCGTVDDVVGQFPKSYHKIFETNKVEHTWFEVIGAGHNAAIINPGFEKFIGEIF